MKDWEKMKMEYETYHVPEELKQRLEETIMKASEERKKNSKKRIFIKVGKIAGLTTIAAMLSITVLANSSATIASAMEEVPIIGAITKVVTFNHFIDKSENYEANVKVPQLVTDETKTAEKEVNKSIEDYTNNLLEQYKVDKQRLGEEGHKALDITYKVITDNDKLFTLRIDTTISEGSSESQMLFYHINKETDQILMLKDLFKSNSNYISIISENIKQQMKERMEKDDSLFYFIDSEFPEDDFEQIKENSSFYIDKEGKLNIVFNKYEVAPGYMGVVEFKIPTEAIQDMLINNYFIQ